MGCGGEEQKMISWPQASRREDEREGNGLEIEGRVGCCGGGVGVRWSRGLMSERGVRMWIE